MTGLTVPYEFEVPVPQASSAGPRGAPAAVGAGPPGGDPPADRVSELSNAMEARLGLVLRKERRVPVEIIVVDEIQKPRPN